MQGYLYSSIIAVYLMVFIGSKRLICSSNTTIE